MNSNSTVKENSQLEYMTDEIKEDREAKQTSWR